MSHPQLHFLPAIQLRPIYNNNAKHTMRKSNINNTPINLTIKSKRGKMVCDLRHRIYMIHTSNTILIIFIHLTLPLNAYCKLNSKGENCITY